MEDSNITRKTDPDSIVINDDINVEEIMKTIRENIAKRKARGAYTKDDELLVKSAAGRTSPTFNSSSPDIYENISYINRYYDISNTAYQITSHRKIIGPALVAGRNIVHSEVKRYVDPVIRTQIEYNTHVTRALNQIVAGYDERFDSLKSGMDTIIDAKLLALKYDISSDYSNMLSSQKSEVIAHTDSEISQLAAMVTDSEFRIQSMSEEVKATVSSSITAARSEFISIVNDSIAKMKSEILSEIESRIAISIDSKVRETLLVADNEISKKTCLIEFLDKHINSRVPVSGNVIPSIINEHKTLDVNYFAFEEVFRGPSKSLKERQSVFIKYYNNCTNVLDIGCGRGEFLEALKENNINATGVDLNDAMVDYCRSLGLSVKKVDAMAYLNTLENNSLDGIFIDQVVEHMDSIYLIDLLRLCNEKLKPGYYIVIETVNPLSLTSLSNFYIDLTHLRPVHPATLRFLMESTGFRDIKLQFYSPIPAEAALKKIDSDGNTEAEKQAVMTYNQNIDRINNILYGAQDYALVGKK